MLLGRSRSASSHLCGEPLDEVAPASKWKGDKLVALHGAAVYPKGTAADTTSNLLDWNSFWSPFETIRRLPAKKGTKI